MPKVPKIKDFNHFYFNRTPSEIGVRFNEFRGSKVTLNL